MTDETQSVMHFTLGTFGELDQAERFKEALQPILDMKTYRRFEVVGPVPGGGSFRVLAMANGDTDEWEDGAAQLISLLAEAAAAGRTT